MDIEALRTLSVLGTYETIVPADRATVRISIGSSSLFNPDVDVRTVREVSELTNTLREHGISESDIHIYNVSAEVHTRIVGKSSSATYRLNVDCSSLNFLPAILRSVRKLNHANILSVDWGYTITSDMRADWLANCARDATIKAKVTAQELGLRLAEIAEFKEVTGQAVRESWPSGMLACYSAAGSADFDEPDLVFSPTKAFSTWAELRYTIENAQAG